MVLSWFELSEEDQPDESIWLDPEALAGHFENVKMRRSAGSGDGFEPVEAAPMWENEDPVTQDEIRRLRSV